MKQMDIFFIKILCILLYFGIVVGIENTYRDYFLTLPLDWEIHWQQGSSDSLKTFFKVIYQFGTFPVYLPICVIIFFTQSLNKFYTLISVLIYTLYFHFIFKIIYAQPRPFFYEPSLALQCTGEFGNPSGHAMNSFPFYLTLWHILCRNKWMRIKYAQIILLFFFILLILTICLSVIFLGSHFVNQVLFGLSLGPVPYFFFVHILHLHKAKGEAWWVYFTHRYLILSQTIVFVILLVLAILLYYLQQVNFSWQLVFNLVVACPNLQWYLILKNASLTGSLYILLLVGFYSGFVYLIAMIKKDYPEKKEEIRKWKYSGFKNLILKILLFILCASPLLLFLLPSNINPALLYIFKISVPLFLSSFLISGVYIFSCVKLKLA